MTDYILEDQVGFLLRLAYQRHISIFASQPIGDLTPVQFSVLYRLFTAHAPVSQNALGRMVGMDAATTKGVVGRLHERGLVAKCESEQDKRRYLLSLTPAGKSVVETCMPFMQLVSKATLAPLAPKEQEALIALLKRLI